MTFGPTSTYVQIQPLLFSFLFLFNLDPAGKCNETIDGPVPFSMSPDNLFTEIVPPFCLEEGKRYQIKLTFDQYDDAKSDPKSNILIDSVSLNTHHGRSEGGGGSTEGNFN